jgi:hypothetical protein
MRDIHKEQEIEKEISKILREKFSFRFVIINDETKRIGSRSRESALIATIAGCNICKSSKSWFGNNSSEDLIREKKIWNRRHVNDNIMNSKQINELEIAVNNTLKL